MSLSDVVGGSGLHSWSELGLIVSFITFLAVLVWLYVIRRGPTFEEQRLLPLEDDPVIPADRNTASKNVAPEIEEVDDK